MRKKNRICALADLRENQARGFVLDAGATSLVLVRRGARVYCYRNSCPHTGVCLDWVPDQFLDSSGIYLQCATHGALFQVDTGFCIAGPCAGDALIPVGVRIEGEEIFRA